ncbi:MAG: TIGR04149 family rSAM-modified RiPP [Bacteroidales bacterium]|nr:TIGR04149 family rSAM-modified RiPP [Bacteroidales bacterium]
MKKLGKIKLNHLSKNALDARLQNVLKGGETCWCSCSGSVCSCSSWDGAGTMPPSQSSTDMGLEYVNGNASSSLESHFY